jgi:integrase
LARCEGDWFVRGAFFLRALDDLWAVGVSERDSDRDANAALVRKDAEETRILGEEQRTVGKDADLMLKRAGLPKIRLHDSRHTTLSLMEKAGVPISIVSKWAGHYDAAFTMRTYVHASDDDLKQGRQALAKVHKIA